MKLLRLPTFTAAPPRFRLGRRTRAARSVAAFLALAVAGNVGFALMLEYGPPRLRDPEYGKRLAAVRTRTAADPGRPLVLVVGSSRVSMGLRPDAVEGEPGPRLGNLSLVGSGPILELLAVRRALADGVKPAAVLLEYWPAFLREDGPYHEQVRIDVSRLWLRDRPVIDGYFHDPAAVERRMWADRVVPWHSHRKSLLNQFQGGWLPYSSRTDGSFEKIDGWGWLPGRPAMPPECHAAGHKAAGDYYLPLFQGYRVSPEADRALRECVALCRAAGVPVGLVVLPESTGFRQFMTADAVRQADDHLARLRADLDLPVIDARTWLADEHLPDGFHLTQPGAAEFTRKLLPAVRATFPQAVGP